MNAVLDWLDKSNRMDESSVDTVSVASSNANFSQPCGKTSLAVRTIPITKERVKTGRHLEENLNIEVCKGRDARGYGRPDRGGARYV